MNKNNNSVKYILSHNGVNGMSIQYFVHLSDCQSSLMSTIFVVAAKVSVVYLIQVLTGRKSMTQIVRLHGVRACT